MTSLRYAIIGTGAIGGYFGSKLQQAGCDVHFLLRSDYDHVKVHGLKIESVDGDFELPTVQAYDQASNMPPVDVAIVALKTTTNPQVSKLFPPLKSSGTVLCLQNGLGVEGAISRQLKDANGFTPAIIGGLCFICAVKSGPGQIHHIDYGQLMLGAHQNAQQRCEPTVLMKAIAADFDKANVSVKLTDDLPMERWRKLVWNVPYNGLSVVLNATTEEMMADDGVRSLITILMKEVVAIANAWGEYTSPGTKRNLPIDIVENMLVHTDAMAPYRTSMKVDYDEKRPLEIQAILTRPLKEAQSLGISVPAMTMLHHQLAFLTQGLRQ
ncbi:MAG: putative 2-dehydropantoate 2-reductase [Cyanobacteria bacterium J06621_3]